MARKNAAALVLTSTSMAGYTEAAVGAGQVARRRDLLVAVDTGSSVDWWWTMVFTVLVIYAAVLLAFLLKRQAPTPQSAAPTVSIASSTTASSSIASSSSVSTCHVQTQSQVTYTSVRGWVTPRFHPLADREQGFWRHGCRELMIEHRRI